MKKLITAAVLAAVLLLTGCREGNPLPEGMDREALLSAGREMVALIADGDFESFYNAMRQDAQEQLSAHGVELYFRTQTDGCGVFQEIEDSMTTGQTANGEQLGVAVFYCAYSEAHVLIRIAFDTDLVPVGLEIRKQQVSTHNI